MFVIMVLQFNALSTFVVMSAIVLPSRGVLLGTLITGHPFGIVMGGIGVSRGSW
jgi:multidrug efflux pump